MVLNPSTLREISSDVKQALENWTDVPEYVRFRYREENGIIIIDEYDDAMPGQRVEQYTLNIVVRKR